MHALLASLLLALPAAAQIQVDAHRQFDFWVGEWSVQNRHLQADGAWGDGDVTRARITAVLDGRAVLEEWAGPFRGAFMNGFSLRAYDPEQRDWNLLLFWTTNGDGAFGTLRGAFRHGRGEFFTGGGANLTRYSFSDGLPNSVRWDSATSSDRGVTWKTDWIMEFSRTRAAAEVTEERLFAVDWTEGSVSQHPEARGMDWLVGTWSGVQLDASGGEREARLRCKPLNQDCLVLDVLETRPSGVGEADDGWTGRLTVRGFESRRGGWSAWHLTEGDTTLRQAAGSIDTGDAVFEYEQDGHVWRETLTELAGGDASIELERRPADSGPEAFERVWLTELGRD